MLKMPHGLVALVAVTALAVPVTAYAASLQTQLDALQAQIDAIVLLPGPPGDTGPEGPPGPAGGDVPYRFVGFSSSEAVDLVAGDEGLPTLYAACQDAGTGFGPDARMCTTEEILRSPNIEGTQDVTLKAWIYPTIIGFTAGANVSDMAFSTVLDFSGLTERGQDEVVAAHAWTCTDWTGGPSGLSIDEKARFQKTSCNESNMVTCCARAK